MRRVVRYHRVHSAVDVRDGLPDASGYHDPVTTQFIRATTLVRSTRRVDPICFERTALGKAANGPTSSARPKKPPKAQPQPKEPRSRVLARRSPEEA